MKNWKKLLATGLSTALILGTLASCGGGNTSSPAARSGAGTLDVPYLPLSLPFFRKPS